MHFSGLFLQLPWRLYPIPKHLIYTKPGPASQYFCHFLIASPNLRTLAISPLASILILTVMTIAERHLMLFSWCSFSRSSLTSHRGFVLNEMPVEDFTSLLKSSMFLCLRYCYNDIPCTFKRCYYSSISIPITASSIAFDAWINIFDRWGNSIVASALSRKRADEDPNSGYFILINHILGATLTFCKASLMSKWVN